MRARTREVNIFNMSLLDILCGALGAFCFMMLVLLPYYRPAMGSAGLQQEQANTDELLKKLEQLRNQTKDSALADELNDLVDKLQKQIKELQGQVNQYSSENQRLDDENKQLTDTNKKQSDKLAMRNPFVVMMGCIPLQDVDVYLASDTVSEKNTSNPPFDPIKTHNEEFWAGDTATWWPSHGVTVWLSRDGPPNSHFKVYAKLADAANRTDASLTGNIKAAGLNIPMPSVPLTAARYWTLMGTISIDNDYKITFTEATEAERDAEWRKLAKTAPPPLTAATPAVQGSASPTTQRTPPSDLSRDEMDRRRQEYIKRRSQQSAAPAASPGVSP
jgi:TolA-binding protein